MASVEKAVLGDKIDEVKCANCKKEELHYIIRHGKKHIFGCYNCFKELDIIEKKSKALEERIKYEKEQIAEAKGKKKRGKKSKEETEMDEIIEEDQEDDEE